MALILINGNVQTSVVFLVHTADSVTIVVLSCCEKHLFLIIAAKFAVSEYAQTFYLLFKLLFYGAIKKINNCIISA